ncbi:hypothetical protein DMUE_2453 [Dictyocoela muelleri]|nr:hypothetical protein DMUE_2453 [Dictyocoela muelleri]
MKLLKLSNNNEKIKISRPLKINSIILDYKIEDKLSTTLFVIENNYRLPICTLIPGNIEMINVNFILNSEIQFQISNNNKINLIAEQIENKYMKAENSNKNINLIENHTNNSIDNDKINFVNINDIGNDYKIINNNLVCLVINSEINFRYEFNILFTLATTESRQRVSLIVDIENIDHTICNLFPEMPNFNFKFLYKKNELLKFKIIGDGCVILWGYIVYD